MTGSMLAWNLPGSELERPARPVRDPETQRCIKEAKLAQCLSKIRFWLAGEIASSLEHTPRVGEGRRQAPHHVGAEGAL